MSQGPTEAEAAPEPVDGSVSALTFDSDTETKLNKKTVCRSPKSPKSPYTSGPCFRSRKPGLSRPFKGTEHRHFDIPLVKTSRALWCGSPRQGTRHSSPTKPDLDGGPTLSMTLPGSTPEYLKEALGMKKPKHARSSSSGYIPGTPHYKEKEDMYDEIIELKKTIQAQKREADRMKTKIRRLEEENSRKDKQIEQLLESSRASEFGLVWTEQKNDTALMISGLKQKILRLEQHCKEKDNTINKLQADEKKTSVEEMRIALQTYYEEIQRLQSLLAKSKAVQRKSSPENSQQKAFNAAVVQLSRSIKALQKENWKLKADLDHMLSSFRARNQAKSCTEWSRPGLVQRILKLEKKMGEMEKERLQLSEAATPTFLTPLAPAQQDQSNSELSCGPRLSQRAAESQAEEEAAVRLIQSVFRAHLARTQTEERSPIPGPRDENTGPFVHQEGDIWSPFKCSPLVFTSAPTDSAQTELQPSPLPPVEEGHSDDSDEIITISPSRRQRRGEIAP